MGIFIWNPGKREDLDLLQRLLDAGRIKPLIDRGYGLSQVPEALRYVEEGRARGKVVITVELWVGASRKTAAASPVV